MKSMNNLLLLGDGESWSRQTVDFAGIPEMARTFLQVAAGAADIPVMRLLGQSPSGLSATGESDVRNYYDMIAARQELDLRPQLEWLDRLICWSEDIDEGALSFAFRPLWQLDEPARAALALAHAQATQVYAGLKLWPDAVLARLAEAQLVADETYPNAAAVFTEAGATADAGKIQTALDFNPTQPRDLRGRWTIGAEGSPAGAPSVPSNEIAPTANSSGFRPPDGTPIPPTSAGPSKADTGPHAPDGTPITLAASADDPQGLKIAKAAATAVGLNRAQRRIFHDAITGQGITDYQELLSIALGVKKGEYP